MKKLLVFFLLISQISLFGADRAFVRLHGTYGTGTEKIARAIETLDDSWVFIDEDSLYRKRIIRLLAGIFPSQYQAIAQAIDYDDRYVAIKWNHISFREGITDLEKDDAIRAIQAIQEFLDSSKGIYFKVDLRTKFRSDVIEMIRVAAGQGKNIIIGASVPFPQPPEDDLEGYKAYNVLAFQSFSSAIVSFEEKRQAAEEDPTVERPFLTELLISFDQLFHFSPEQTDRTVAQMERREVQEFFQYARGHVEQSWEERSHLAFTGQEMNLTSLFRMRRDFLSSFYETRPEQISYLESKKDYDLVLYTDEKTADTIARAILRACL